MNNKYTVSVLFVNYEDFWSKVVYYVLGRGYSHAAISVDDEGETYYSFNFKGFRRERPRKHEDIVSKSVCYKLSVSKKEYDSIAQMIEEFQSQRFEWRYNLMGLLLSRVHISRRRHKHYYCSEFVAEMLQKAQVYDFKKNLAHYLPNRLEREIQTFRNLEQVILNPIQRSYM
jgi:inositol transport system substrate-binding protein